MLVWWNFAIRECFQRVFSEKWNCDYRKGIVFTIGQRLVNEETMFRFVSYRFLIDKPTDSYFPTIYMQIVINDSK